MKRVLGTIVIILMITSCLSAQTPKVGVTFYLNSGLSLPLAPKGFSDYWNSSANFGGGAGYKISPYLTLQGFFTSNSFGFNDDQYIDYLGVDIAIDGGGLSITTATLNVKASFIASGGRVTPYFVGGLGYFKISGDDITYTLGLYHYTIPGPESKSTLASCIGFGVDIMVIEMAGIFIEFTSTAGGVELKSNLPDFEEGIVGYAPFRIGAYVEL